MKVNGKVIVVTGAGDGVGRQLTLQLLEKGAIVAGVDNHKARLLATKKLTGDNPRFSIHHLDVADSEAVEALSDQLLQIHGVIDGLINDAGIIQPFIDINDLDVEQIKRVMNVNFYGQLYMIKAFLPLLLERTEAQILNISSMGGFLPVPGQTAYGASKAAVIMLTGGLRSELRRTNIGVALVIPGSMNTNITQNSGVPVDSADPDSPLAKMLLQPEKAAAKIIKAFEKNKRVTYLGKDTNFFNVLNKFAPKLGVKLINKALTLRK